MDPTTTSFLKVRNQDASLFFILLTQALFCHALVLTSSLCPPQMADAGGLPQLTQVTTDDCYAASFFFLRYCSVAVNENCYPLLPHGGAEVRLF